MSQIISNEALRRLIDQWTAESALIAGPAAGPHGRVFYKYVEQSGELLLDHAAQPTNSIKEFFFPRHEKLYEYRVDGKEIELIDAEPFSDRQIIIGARPCDAAALPILDHVFTWDFEDAFYTRRREQTTVVTLGCKRTDPFCFCTSVGLAPDATLGADAMLVDLEDGAYEVRVLTEKGRALFNGKTQESDKVGRTSEGPAAAIDMEKVNEFMLNHFDTPKWETWSLRCLGCGGCSYVCPTCHCFDIVDEGNSRHGIRSKNWDSCQFPLFTLHASGHNPRSVQAQRQRQRINHKFNVYPDKFGEILCTGCGNCGRACPESFGVRRMLETIVQEVAKQDGAEQST